MSDDKEYDINGIPEGFTVWLMPHTEEIDGEEVTYSNVIVKGESVVVCDECPCTVHCWHLFESECTVEIVDDEEGNQYREVTWSDPVYLGAHCGPEPDIADSWFFVGYGLMNYYAKGAECRLTSAYCDEEMPPDVAAPDIGECCDYAPISQGTWELPYEWDTVEELWEVTKTDEDGNEYTEWEWRERRYKVYSDFSEEDGTELYLSSYSTGDCEWVEWTIEIADFEGTIYKRTIFPDDTYMDEELGSSSLMFPDEEGNCPLSAVIHMCPQWEVQLYLVTDFAWEYNMMWEDQYSEVRPNAYAWVHGVGLSEPCIYYCHLKMTAKCDTAPLEGEECSGGGKNCPCVGDTEIEGPLNGDAISAQAFFQRPFPYNGPESMWYNPTDNWSARNSGWLIKDEDNEDGYWRAVRRDKCDKEATWIQLLCVSENFSDWLDSGGTEEITCQDWEEPAPGDCPSQDCDPTAEKHPLCPPDPDLWCLDDLEAKTLDSFTSSKAYADKTTWDLSKWVDKEGVGCPGQRWRIKDVGGPQPGYTAEEGTGCECYEDDGETIKACPPRDDSYCDSEYNSGEVDECGRLKGIPPDWSTGFCYWGHMELQLSKPLCDGGHEWPKCNDY